MILKRPNGKWRVKVKFRSVIVADRTFDRRGDAVRWEMEQKRILDNGDFVPPAAVGSRCGSWRTSTATLDGARSR